MHNTYQAGFHFQRDIGDIMYDIMYDLCFV